MGTFAGHAVPGTLFITVAIWWALNNFIDYYKSRSKNGKPFRCQPNYMFPFWCFKGIPIESWIKIGAVLFGMTGEFVTAIENGRFEHIGNAQHMTMFFFFGLNGAMDLLSFYRFPVPEGIEAASGIVAYACEGLLFYFHLHGRTTMDKQVHMLLFFTICCCVFSIFMEIIYRDSVLATLARSYFTLLQGTWFYQVGFILYPPLSWMKGWEQEDHEQMMIVTLLYTWHCAANFVLLLLIGWGVLFVRRHIYPGTDIEVHYSPLSSTTDALIPMGGSNKINGKSKINGHAGTNGSLNHQHINGFMESDSEGV